MKRYSVEDFDYSLPKEFIAQYPLPNRDESNLLVYRKDKSISHYKFYDLPFLIPRGSLLLRNVSKVIPARLFFKKITGGKVEVLLLEPLEPSTDPQIAFLSKGKCTWKALLRGRNLKKISTLLPIDPSLGNSEFFCNIIEKKSDHYVVDFTWRKENYSFLDILETLGKIPLPPYIQREGKDLDRERYQTIYGYQFGSVASHTAGLHFSENVIKRLEEKEIYFSEITLHIGMGTFKPIQNQDIFEHKMHDEKFAITHDNLQKIYDFFKKRINSQLFVAVGTTSVRTLESIYWLAQKLHFKKGIVEEPSFEIEQYIWKEVPSKLNPIESIEFMLNVMSQKNFDKISGSTKLYITPNYKINFFDALITNFHQPKSTLLLLIGAFVGEDWKKIYSEALSKSYRFLSYGDASLLYNINK